MSKSRLLSILRKNGGRSTTNKLATVATRHYNRIGLSSSSTIKYDYRSFSAMALQQHQTTNPNPPSSSSYVDHSHLYNTTYHPQAPEPNYTDLGPTSKLNLFTAINSAMQTAMKTDPTAIMFGEDVAFGGVFRCSQDLREEFGEGRVFNTPLSENGIAGMAIGYASAGGTAIGEIQFGDYIFPAFDQIVNEMAKFRFRSGNQWNCGGVTLRTPVGAVSCNR